MFNTYELKSLCEGMSDMAAKHPNDIISNALARVSRKIEYLGSSKFAPELDKTDKQIIMCYLYMKNKQTKDQTK